MKVIIQSYNTCCQNASGGVQNRLRKIASLLEKRDFEVELFDAFETKLHKDDILHVFMLSIDNAPLIRYAKAIGVKIVISTIIPMIGENKLRIYKTLDKLPLVTTYKMNKWSLEFADALITESQMESAFIHKYYGIESKKMHVIPNGVDYNDYDGDEIFQEIGTHEKYVLQVGRFDTNKNQLNVIKALKGKPFHVVFIGGAEKRSSTYYEKCLREAEGYDNIHFLGWIDNNSKLLQSAYSHADTVILASHYETFGLTAIEGGAKGAKLAFSNTLPIYQYPEFQNCPSFNPSNVKEIESVITSCVAEKNDGSLKEKVMNGFNWNTIIDKHIALYKSI